MKQDWSLARLVYGHCRENPQYAQWGLHATEAFDPTEPEHDDDDE